MSRKKILFFTLISVVFLVFSACSSRKDLNYMQNIDQIATNEHIKMNQVTIQPGDKLVISIIATDLDVVKPFNQNYSSAQIPQNNGVSGNATTSSPTYIVDAKGNIEMPILGLINTTDKNVNQLEQILKQKLLKYIKDPIVAIKLSNFKVSVLGEVNRPGEYTIADGQTNLLNVLSMAGDLTIQGVRDDILVVRNVDGKLGKEKIDITNANFINSPYYNLKQGDVIYVSANKTKQKASRQDPNAPIYISVAGIIVTILALLFK